MSAFSSWILSIAGIAVMGVVLDLVLPEGQMQKYVKVVYSFIVVFVIISPLPKLFNGSFDFEAFFGSDYTNSIQTEFIGIVNEQKKEAIEKNIVSSLEMQGISGVIVDVQSNIFETDFKISYVVIDVGQVVINSEQEHIDMLALVKKTIINITGVKEDMIIIDE
ncbi:MAG: stage III sporulation protein AF [Clostridia bacterium]